MKFTDKDLLKAMGLELGDIILIENKQWEIIKTNNGLRFWRDDYTQYEKIELLIGLEFEKVEQKILDNARYELGEDKAYFINSGLRVDWTRFYQGTYKDDYITDFDEILFFTKRKYAEEYLEELKKFNEEYKKNNL